MSVVHFESAGVRLAGVHLRGRGDEFADREGRRPCVVLAHGFAGTVDSGLLPFAERYAAAGLDTLAFDYRHFGLSEGSPRQLVSISAQQADYAAAIAFARAQEGVDPERIVLWGTSFSGGHVVPVAVKDGRVAAVISQVPNMDGVGAVQGLIRDGGARQLLRLTVAGLRDQLAALRGEKPFTIGVVGPAGSLAAMTSADAEPGYLAIAGPSWRNEVAARIGLWLGSYRPGRQAGGLPCPMLVQIADSDSVVSAKGAQDAAWLATGRGEVRTYPIGHFEIYAGAPFEKAVSDQLLFLRRHVRGSEASKLVTTGQF